MSIDARAAPTADLIESIRKRFPVEREIDRVLSEKMRRRSGPGFSGIPLEKITEGAHALLRCEIGDDFSIMNARWLQGGASKLQVAFDLQWNEPDHGKRQITRMVLRMELPESIVETSRRREYLALQAMQGIVPVPRCHWIDAEGTFLPHPGLVYEFSEGSTKPTALQSKQVTGIGTNFGPELRGELAQEFVSHLASIHKAAPERLLVDDSFDRADPGSNESVIRQVNWWRRVFEEDRPEEHPLVVVAYAWLIANAPVLDRVSIVHGDYRSGNFLFSEQSRRITAWLDWELSVLGDRHQDLAWAASPYFGHFAEDGRTFLVSGMLPDEEFLRRYEDASGLSVDPRRIKYFHVFNAFVSTVHMFASAYRVAHQSKTHQDIVVAWLAMVGHSALGNLRDLLEEAL